jgi:hypothetical protein
MSKKSVFIPLGAIIFAGLATALMVGFATSASDKQSVPSLGPPIAFASAAMPDAARSGLTSAANVAGVDSASLQRVGASSGPGVVFGKDRAGAVEWAAQSLHSVTAFSKAADSLSKNPVALGVDTYMTSDGGIVSNVTGLYDTMKVAVVRVSMFDGSVTNAAASSIPNTSYESFVLSTTENVNPVLFEALDSSGTVVYRQQIDVSPQCFAAGAHC